MDVLSPCEIRFAQILSQRFWFRVPSYIHNPNGIITIIQSLQGEAFRVLIIFQLIAISIDLFTFRVPSLFVSNDYLDRLV